MLYSIIPPILIVISLAGIIIFLIKKAPAVARLEENILASDGTVEKKKSFFARFKKNENGQCGKDFKQKMLLFLEKRVAKTKVMFLKLENFFSAWGESIRNKRKAREEENNIQLSEISEEKNILENIPAFEKEEVIEKKEKREIFEKILVERIAVNPKDIEAYERLGEYYLEIENLNYSKECFKQVLKLNPQNRSVKNKMRKLERMLGK
ncbi:MAG: hypothetical protein A2271_00880 [Candidatus Moranbacteria bacterium RIFOXYA12_FULL_35_19]|nr:MAG: hypothetical protein A2343_03330 [Candidatus Moranbacteria bacterium RIFOXYB12_FULL_35_8]OGI35129.1 MAG: hypothetical protein A2271_00880 [Candidatus Moranbacteria bacterium RIFOXYA12_FULL_35_19]